jgi:hypothetical protein
MVIANMKSNVWRREIRLVWTKEGQARETKGDCRESDKVAMVGRDRWVNLML